MSACRDFPSFFPISLEKPQLCSSIRLRMAEIHFHKKMFFKSVSLFEDLWKCPLLPRQAVTKKRYLFSISHEDRLQISTGLYYTLINSDQVNRQFANKFSTFTFWWDIEIMGSECFSAVFLEADGVPDSLLKENILHTLFWFLPCTFSFLYLYSA